MSRSVTALSVGTGRFPRVSGDEPDPAAKFPELNAFSPRERG